MKSISVFKRSSTVRFHPTPPRLARERGALPGGLFTGAWPEPCLDPRARARGGSRGGSRNREGRVRSTLERSQHRRQLRTSLSAIRTGHSVTDQGWSMVMLTKILVHWAMWLDVV